MARDLKKFVNNRFLKTCDLALLRRVLERHQADVALNLELLDGPAVEARSALQAFFAGPEDNYPPGLVADLHRIAELATDQGMRIILERARASGTAIIRDSEAQADEAAERLDPRHIAIRTFLDHPELFEAATDLLAIDTSQSVTEFSGIAEGIEANLSEEARAAFEVEAQALFAADFKGRYCRTGWYDDAGELNLVITHGAQITSTPVVRDGTESLISFRPADHAVMSYRVEDGRLKVGGAPKALRGDLARIFARTILEREGFFDGDGSQNLYTLSAAESVGPGFRIEHAHDPRIRSVRVVEVDVQQLLDPGTSGRSGWQWALVVKDRTNALERLGRVAPGITLGQDGCRLSHLVLRVEIDAGAKRPVRVTVKVKPPGTALFKRERFEGCIMDLLWRNGLCLDRDAAATAAAA